MNKFKKIASLVLAFAMVLSLGVTAFAANDINTAGNDATVPVVLTAAAAKFSVTVPTSLPISVDADGNVTTATDVKIVNHSHGMVEVQDLEVSGANSWSTISYDSADVGALPVGSKMIALEIHGEKTTGANANTFTKTGWAAMDAANATATDELPFTYAAHIPAQATALSGDTVANVVFTVGWHTAD